MKYVSEYREAVLVRGVIEEIRRTVTHTWTIMEIYGGQTHAIVRHGIDQLLPPEIELVHGPGYPPRSCFCCCFQFSLLFGCMTLV